MYPADVRFNHVQVLRLFAAATVVLDHTMIFTNIAHPGLVNTRLATDGGWIGGWSVSLFFAISGFVITHSSQGRSPLGFLRLRLLRIFPAYWLACLAVAAVKLAIWGSLPWAAAGYTWQSLSLLPFGHLSYPLLIEWSLIYEVFFYLLFALFLFAPGRFAKLYLSLIWLAAIVLAAATGHDISDRFPGAGAIFLSSRNLPFIAGVILYFCAHARPPRGLAAVMPLCAVAIALSAQIFNVTFWIMVTQALSASLVLALAVRRDHDRPIAATNFLVIGGAASYGIYLVHIAVIDIVLHLWHGAVTAPVMVGSLFIFALAVGALFGVAESALHTRLLAALRPGRPPAPGARRPVWARFGANRPAPLPTPDPQNQLAPVTAAVSER